MCSFWIAPAARDSRRNRRKLSEFAARGSSIFSATVRLDSTSSATKTVPIPPWPRWRTRRYFLLSRVPSTLDSHYSARISELKEEFRVSHRTIPRAGPTSSRWIADVPPPIGEMLPIGRAGIVAGASRRIAYLDTRAGSFFVRTRISDFTELAMKQNSCAS